MPADIVGTHWVAEEGGRREYRFRPGPVFANVVLADEVNRATPKTQSALLEAMEERQVTVGGETLRLPAPFLVLATENPIEMEGTYPLPEAQLDRFLLKALVPHPSAGGDGDDPRSHGGRDPARRSARSSTARGSSPCSPSFDASCSATGSGRTWRVSSRRRAPRRRTRRRASRASSASARARAPRSPSCSRARSPRSPRGRGNVARDDVRAFAASALRHRLVLNFEAEAEGVTAETILEDVLAHVGDG